MRTVASPLPVLAAVAAIGILSVMDAVIKQVALAHPLGQVVFLRFATGTVAVLAWMVMTRAPRPTRGSFRRAAIRAVVILATALLFFGTLTLLPLAEAVAITFVAPFLMLIVSRILLGEPMPRRALGAIAVGFAGVLVMLGGRLSDIGGGHPLGYVTGLASAVSYAVSMVLTRRHSGEDGVVQLVAAQNVTVAAIAAPLGVAQWVTPDLHAGLLFAAAGLLGTAGHLVLAWAYARAPASRLAPLEYSAFLWAAGLGALVFGEVPTPATVAGAALIVGACVVTFRPAAGRS